MSEEKKYFICKNEKCSGEEGPKGGTVFQYEPPQNKEIITCPVCGCGYEEEGGELYLSFGGEIEIKSSEDFKAFNEQFESCRIAFSRLVLRNIDEPYYEGENLSFSKCWINELVIEDVNISSAYYPILFSDCSIKKVRITNSKITKTSLNSYKSLWSFFGITFFNTQIHESFIIDQCETSIIVTNCQVHCPIDISKRSTIDLAWIHNKKKPELKTKKGSTVNQIFEDEGKAHSASEKTLKTSGTSIRGINIDELYIDPNIEEESILENCTIHKLVFKEGSSIKGKLLFNNCSIENTQNEPYCFEQDLIFHRCTFKQEFAIIRSNFNLALIFEFCTFMENMIFNDLNIDDDFQISYSTFMKQLFIYGNNFGNYFKYHLNLIHGEIKFEDNVVARDVNFRAIHSNNIISITHNEIKGYLFLRQIHTRSNLEIRRLNADAITINYVFVEGSFSLDQSMLKTDLSLFRMEVNGITTIDDSTLGGAILKRSFFEGQFIAYSLTTRYNKFSNLFFKSFCYLHTCSVSQDTSIRKCIFQDWMDWENMNTESITFSHNYFIDDLKFKTIEAAEIMFANNNIINQSIEISDARTQDIQLFDNKVARTIKIEKSKIQDIEISQNTAEKLVIENTKAEDISLRWNEISEGISFIYLNLRDFVFDQNKTSELSISKNCTFLEVSISDCEEIGKIQMYDISISSNLKIFDNHSITEVYLNKCDIKNWVEINDSNIGLLRVFRSNIGYLGLQKCRIVYNEIYKNLISNDLMVNSCDFDQVYLQNIVANDIDIIRNIVREYLYIDDAKANDIKVEENRVASDYKKEEEAEETNERGPEPGITIKRCNIESRLDILDNQTFELLQIYQTFADILWCTRNYTKLLEISLGKYRLLGVNNSLLGKFNCNNVSINKDATFRNNSFYQDFVMLNCKIEHSLEFNGNIFTEGHKLRNNTILGPLKYLSFNERAYKLRFQPVKVNQDYEFSTLRDYPNFFFLENQTVHNSFSYDIFIQNNTLNTVDIKQARVESVLYFDDNAVLGRFSIGDKEILSGKKDIVFSKALSIKGNKINNAGFYNVSFLSPICMHQNNFEGDLTFRNTDHQMTLDFKGCFIGGSFEFQNTKEGSRDGDLILDKTFIDKRLSFENYTPNGISFINATFNGFEIPPNWRMRWKKLIDKNRLTCNTRGILKNIRLFRAWVKKLIWGDKGSFIFEEDNSFNANRKESNLPYSLIKEFIDQHTKPRNIRDQWNDLNTAFLSDSKKVEMLDQTHQKDQAPDAVLISEYYYLFNQCIQEDFIPVYYKFFNDETFSAIHSIAWHFANTPNNYKDAEPRANYDRLKNFFGLFHNILGAYHQHSVEPVDRYAKRTYKNTIRSRLEEQYHVLRHIWGSNGELKEEDIAYYTWMHHKNIAEMHEGSVLNKLKAWIKYLLYEKIFGWGVRLPRIVLSTFILTVIFGVIYWIIFQLDPELYIHWDTKELHTPNLLISWVFAVQTTFSAGLGDWAPIGSGVAKIPMTINAVLGILFVTFLIGAYGRKMLR